MPIIVIIPALVLAIALWRKPLPQVFLRYFLPLFLLFPSYYYWKVAALPPITVADSILLPMGVVTLVRQWRHWRVTTMDLWMLLFIASSCVAVYATGDTTAAIFQLFTNLVEAGIPYMLGKLLIEQSRLRAMTVRRIVELLAFCAIISFYEYKMMMNPFTLIWARFFPAEHFAWKTQIRWGGGRVSGPFGQSELAGMIILFGLVMALWIAYAFPRKEKLKYIKHPFKKSTVLTFLLGAFLLSSQARGPWIGLLISIPIAYIGRTKHVIRNSVILVSVLVPLLITGYMSLSSYASTNAPATAEQETAQYRHKLVPNYLPVVKVGGLWGWGPGFPRVDNQDSIDNEYLFIALTQGYIGFFSFALIALESTLRLTWSALMNAAAADRSFSFSLLGVLLGLVITISTVFLGNQPFQLFFLLAGWSQVLGPRPLRVVVEEKPPRFEHVYT